MRTTHELLILLRDNIKPQTKYLFWKRINAGLCFEKYQLVEKGLIDDDEYLILSYYLNDNLPPKTYNWFYYWKPKLWKPRLKWLNKHIKLTK